MAFVSSITRPEFSDTKSATVGGSPIFWALKRSFDLVGAIILFPLLLVFAAILLFANPLFNPGPLFFIQIRMGLNCRAFYALKFRTMRNAPSARRNHDDPLEADRITPLGRILRRTRIDELPQILNVLKGDMSLIGPRPDSFSHARAYKRLIPEYALRHSVRPGISGLAQVDLGYAVGVDATRNKALADLFYIRNASFTLELRIIALTIYTIICRRGA